MNDKAILVVRDYIAKLKLPYNEWRKPYFEQASYAIWAANEVLRSIENNKSIPPIMVVEDFIRKMDAFSCINANNSRMFSIAHDTAQDILDVFLGIDIERRN